MQKRARIGRVAWVAAAGCWVAAVGGCGGAFRAELATARELDSAAGAIEPALHAYHREVQSGLEAEQARAAAAFAEGSRRNVGNDASTEADLAKFEADLDGLDGRREAESERYQAVVAALKDMRVTAAQLRRFAELGSGLQGLLRRFLDMLSEAFDPAVRSSPVPKKH